MEKGHMAGFWGIDNILFIDYSGNYLGICSRIITQSYIHALCTILCVVHFTIEKEPEHAMY